MEGNLNTLISVDIYGKKYRVSKSQLVWRPAAYAIVTRSENILLVKHNDKYHLPGGGVELGEDPADGVLRELREETGYQANRAELVDLVSTFFTFEVPATRQLYHYQSLLIYFKCELANDKPRQVELDEFEKLYGHTFEWLPLKDLDSVVVGTSVDWRHIVDKVVKYREGQD